MYLYSVKNYFVQNANDVVLIYCAKYLISTTIFQQQYMELSLSVECFMYGVGCEIGRSAMSSYQFFKTTVQGLFFIQSKIFYIIGKENIKAFVFHWETDVVTWLLHASKAWKSRKVIEILWWSWKKCSIGYFTAINLIKSAQKSWWTSRTLCSWRNRPTYSNVTSVWRLKMRVIFGSLCARFKTEKKSLLRFRCRYSNCNQIQTWQSSDSNAQVTLQWFRLAVRFFF